MSCFSKIDRRGALNEKQQNVWYIVYFIGKGKITAQELADCFEASVRTIYRDLLDLPGAGFPVTTQQGIGGSISLLPNFKYSKSVLNKEDLE